MKTISTSQIISIPEGVTLECKARKVRVKGPRGVLQRSFEHTEMETTFVNKQKLKVTMWHAGRKHSACLRTTCSHIQNMIKGVLYGFQYKMRFVYAHFPINVNVNDNGKSVEIRNFLGEKVVRKVNMLEGVKAELSKDQKDELTLTGNNIENVSQSAASIRTSVLVKNKDIRKFLDGIYVSEKNVMKTE